MPPLFIHFSSISHVSWPFPSCFQVPRTEIGTLNAWRHIPPALESPDDEAEDAEAPPQVVPPGPTADEAREVMATLEALRLVAQQSGLEGLRRLVRCFEKARLES